MKNKIAAILAALAVLFGMSMLYSPAPASAAILTDVTHAADDSGYTAPIHIVCTNGTHRYLYVGESSVFGSKACSGGGVQRIVVELNQTVYCKNYLPPYQNKYYYSLEYNEVPSYASLKCYMQRPL